MFDLETFNFHYKHIKRDNVDIQIYARTSIMLFVLLYVLRKEKIQHESSCETRIISMYGSTIGELYEFLVNYREDALHTIVLTTHNIPSICSLAKRNNITLINSICTSFAFATKLKQHLFANSKKNKHANYIRRSELLTPYEFMTLKTYLQTGYMNDAIALLSNTPRDAYQWRQGALKKLGFKNVNQLMISGNWLYLEIMNNKNMFHQLCER